MCFLELAADFNVKYAEFGNLTLAQAKLLTDIWTVISVTFYPRKIPLQEFLKLDVVKVRRLIRGNQKTTSFRGRDQLSIPLSLAETFLMRNLLKKLPQERSA